MSETSNFSTKWKAFVVSGMLFSGTITVVTASAMFQIKARGLDDDIHAFKKPWFETLAMFIGMCLCLIWHGINTAVANARKRNDEAKKALLSVNDAEKGYGSAPAAEEPAPENELRGIKWALVFAAPAGCDMIATVLGYIGLMYTTGSVFQILRGFMVVMSALLSVTFMKKKFRPYKFVGVGVVILGLVIVGMSLVLDPSHNEDNESQGSPIFGIALIIAAQLVQATQIIVEEILLTKVKSPPLLIVGMEGMWGILAMIIVLIVIYYIPGKDYGGHWENTIDSFVMMTNDTLLIVFLITYFFAILFYNYFAMCVTQCLYAVNRTIIESARTACIWVADLMLWYWITNDTYSQLGEWWTDWSVLELLGFVVVFVGTMIYNDFLIIPGLNYNAFPPAPAKK